MVDKVGLHNQKQIRYTVLVLLVQQYYRVICQWTFHTAKNIYNFIVYHLYFFFLIND